MGSSGRVLVCPAMPLPARGARSCADVMLDQVDLSGIGDAVHDDHTCGR
jgi:hypothetical protein